MSGSNKKPFIGIIGGMGTAAGLAFQNMFFEYCHNQGISSDQEYPEWIYANASLATDRTEAVKGNGETPVEYLTSIISRMKSAGVDVVVVTCNTVHAFYDEINSSVQIPWIHLQKETGIKLKDEGIKRVGILATEGTIRAGLFSRILEPLGIEVAEPDPDSELQTKVIQSIYDSNFGIKHTGSKISSEAKQLITEAIHELSVESVIAGCTELSIAMDEMDLPVKHYDPMKIAIEVLYKVWTGERSLDSL